MYLLISYQQEARLKEGNSCKLDTDLSLSFFKELIV